MTKPIGGPSEEGDVVVRGLMGEGMFDEGRRHGLLEAAAFIEQSSYRTQTREESRLLFELAGKVRSLTTRGVK